MTIEEFKEIICDEYCGFVGEKCENCILDHLEEVLKDERTK